MEILKNKENNIAIQNALEPQYSPVTVYQKRGPAIFGYQWKHGELVIDEEEAAIRKQMYQLFLQTKRKKATATALNTLGYRTRNRDEFSHTTINRLLHDTTAKGLYKISSSMVVPCPAIITEALWSECQALLQQQSTERRFGPRGTHPFAGLLYCKCGKKMYVYHRNKYPAFRCKVCHTKILVEDMHAIYHEQLKHFVCVKQPWKKETLYTQWPQMNSALQRSIVESITKKIIVFTDTIDISFAHESAFPLPINDGISEQVLSIDTVNKYHHNTNEKLNLSIWS